MRFRDQNLGQNELTHCDARHQIRDFCGQIAPPRPLPGQKAVWCRVMDLARGRLDIDGRLAGLAGRNGVLRLELHDRPQVKYATVA